MTVLLPMTLDKRLAFRVTRRSGSLVAVYPFVLSGLVADGVDRVLMQSQSRPATRNQQESPTTDPQPPWHCLAAQRTEK